MPRRPGGTGCAILAVHVTTVSAAPLPPVAEMVADLNGRASGSAGLSEADLRHPFEVAFPQVAAFVGERLRLRPERDLVGVGRPDYTVHRAGRPNGLPVGFVELKAPGTGVDTSLFSGHDAEQWERFSVLDNLIYCDGNAFALYRYGELVGSVVSTVTAAGVQSAAAIVHPQAEHDTQQMLTEFCSWQPSLPTRKNGAVRLDQFAKMLAPLCLYLRDDVTAAMTDTSTGTGTAPLLEFVESWRESLMRDADDHQFADAYAQTVTFALLLARTAGADPLTYFTAQEALSFHHNLLGEALGMLTTAPSVRSALSAPLEALQRLVAQVPAQPLTTKSGSASGREWLTFYEDFLAAYDPELRKQTGVYYTPHEVAAAQVRLVGEVLTGTLNRRHSYADQDVITLDPALGTGTYLLSVVDHTRDHITSTQGAGAVPSHLKTLAANLRGIELLVGPQAVAHLRLTDELVAAGAELPEHGLAVYLADTLASPNRVPASPPLFLESISRHTEQVQHLKTSEPVVVCIGNPPWDRTDAETGDDSRNRQWVRWGDHPVGGKPDPAGVLLDDFAEPVRQAEEGRELKNLYNLYVYFWRWGLWKTFGETTGLAPPVASTSTEDEEPTGTNDDGGPSRPGVVSFLSPSSYLTGPGFAGMRAYMRQVCDEVWVVDLGGDNRGARTDENVFNIQTPCAFAVAVRTGNGDPTVAATVRYRQVTGTREEKLTALNSITLNDTGWQTCGTAADDPFIPPGTNTVYQSWPLLTELMPWQHSGVEYQRTWPIAPSQQMLDARWKRLLSLTGSQSVAAFKESRNRKVDVAPPGSGGDEWTGIATLPKTAPAPAVRRYGYRSFDRQWAFDDIRLCSYSRPELAGTHSDRQLYLTSLLTKQLGEGPALTVAAHVPDRHHFSGRGGKDVLPLWRDSAATQSNLLPGLTDLLTATLCSETNDSADDGTPPRESGSTQRQTGRRVGRGGLPVRGRSAPRVHRHVLRRTRRRQVAHPAHPRP